MGSKLFDNQNEIEYNSNAKCLKGDELMNAVLKTPFYTVKSIETNQKLYDEVMCDKDISKARPLEEIISEGKYAKFTENR